MDNQLIQNSLFSPIIPFIESIEATLIDLSTAFVIKKRYEVKVVILLPENLKLDRKEMEKYFIEGSVDYQVYMEPGKRKIAGIIKDNDFAEYLHECHAANKKASHF